MNNTVKKTPITCDAIVIILYLSLKSVLPPNIIKNSSRLQMRLRTQTTTQGDPRSHEFWIRTEENIRNWHPYTWPRAVLKISTRLVEVTTTTDEVVGYFWFTYVITAEGHDPIV